MGRLVIQAVLLLGCAGASAETRAVPAADNPRYPDKRPSAAYRMEARDQGIVLRYGDGPGRCDLLGARDVWVFESGGTYYMHYDGAGPKGWLACLAVSNDLTRWEKRGPVLDFGPPGSKDSASASYGVTCFDGTSWHMFYLGTPNTSPAPDLIPSFPYLTLKAKGPSPAGPWTKQKDVTPFSPKPGSYCSATASPGHVVRKGDQYLMFFSASTNRPVLRTLGIARTKDLDGAWEVDPKPLVPPEEQVENTSLYYEPASKTWFLFTNHVGLRGAEYTDAVWVYWSKDLETWDPKHKAVVLDGRNCGWSKSIIGLPAVVPVGKRLALFYDGSENPKDVHHMRRHVGLAWLELPLAAPAEGGSP